MKKYFWIIFGLFFVSRFFFLANYPHFYDSPEYLRESLSGNFFKSLVASHEVVHPVWLFLTQIFQRIISQPTSWELSLISALFGLMSFLAFYFLVKRNFNEKVALFSLIPLIFFPHLWLVQTNVLHESLDHGLLLLALLCFDIFLTKKRFFYFLPALIFLALSIFDFVGILLWSTIFFGLVILRFKRNDWWKNITWGFLIVFLSFVLALAGLYGLLSLTGNIEPISRLKILLLGFGATGIFSDWGLLDILRMLRNDSLILVYGYSVAAILGLISSVIYLVKKKSWPLIIFLLSFFIPFILTGKFWYGGLSGRLAALIAYPLALLLGIMPWSAWRRDRRKIYWVFMAILFLTFLPTFWAYQKTPVPKVQAGLIEEIGLQKEDLLVLSDYQRPQLVYSNAVYLGGNREQQKMIEEKIEKKLSTDGCVFISQQAIDFPYWQYDGQQIHIISKGNKDRAQLKEFLKDKELILVSEDKNYPLLNLYQVK